ncbi:MAG: histidinol-phosphate transaminase [Actinomycetota bacterium]
MRPVELRPDLQDLPPYRAPQIPAEVRLNTNESPLSPPAGFMTTLQRLLSGIEFNRYPDRELTELRSGLAKRFDRDADSVWVANGSNEILQTILLAFGGPERSLLVFEPTYAMYRQLARVSMTRFLAAEIAEPWELDADTVQAAVSEHDPELILLCSPNNPTGRSVSQEVIQAALDAGRGLVVVDQAYGEFGGASAEELLSDNERLVCVRSFSKSWRLAGARLGYAISHPWFVEALQVARLPYHLSALSQAVGRAALEHADELLSGCSQISGERDRVAAALTEMAVKVWPSDANFLLLRTNREAGQLWRALAERGVLVRDFSSQIPGTLRVTISTREENDRFLEALRGAI